MLVVMEVEMSEERGETVSIAADGGSDDDDGN